MNTYLYKYAGPNNIEKIFSNDGMVSFKCSYPKNFNDPYELFLTIDFKQGPEILAFYEDAIGEMPQLPTTCFSKSPTVIPMWAHYANNHEGFAIEINEQKLSSMFKEIRFADITYQDEPDDTMQANLDRAFHICKPRYMYFLHQAVFSAAYFTKNSCWSYEMERRLVIANNYIKHDGDMLIFDIPIDCVNSIIVGARATEETRSKLNKLAAQFKCQIFELKIGRSSTTPFFISKKGRTSIFNGKSLVRSSKYCSKCGEPVQGKLTICSWCRINEAHKLDAAYRNPYRAFANAGILESYIQGMDKISYG